GSNQHDPLVLSQHPVLPFTIPSMFSATSFLQQRCESSGPKQPRNGTVLSQRPDTGQSRSIMRTSSVTVTKPNRVVAGAVDSAIGLTGGLVRPLKGFVFGASARDGRQRWNWDHVQGHRDVIGRLAARNRRQPRRGVPVGQI